MKCWHCNDVGSVAGESYSGSGGFQISKLEFKPCPACEERKKLTEESLFWPGNGKPGQVLQINKDGQSGSFYYKKDGTQGVIGRRLEYKLDCENNYTRIEKKYSILEKLKQYSLKYNISICLRGEIYGTGIQRGGHNPHSILPLDIAFFSVYLIDEKRYARKNDQHYIINVCTELELPMVPLLERDVILTPELIKKYDSDLEKLDFKNFEGVVINTSKDSFKVINKTYDSLK